MQEASTLSIHQKKYSILTILVLTLIFAFVFGALAYVGSAFLPIHFAPESPEAALEGVLLGAILGFVGSLIARNRYNREP